MTWQNGGSIGDPRRVHGVKRAVAVSVGADHTLLLSAVSQPPLPLCECELYHSQSERSTHAYGEDLGRRDADTSVDEGRGDGGMDDDDELISGAFSGSAARAMMEEAESEEGHRSEQGVTNNDAVVLDPPTVSHLDCESGDADEEKQEKIPSLFAICQRQVAKSVNTKTVLNALHFADNFDAQLLSAYCTAYIQK